MKGEGDVHAVDGDDDHGDAEDDGEGCEQLDGAVDVVGKDDVVRIAQGADALDIDSAHIFRLVHGDHQILEEIEILLIEIHIPA